MDIREGDILVVSGVDYPIRSVAEWDTSQLTSTRSFRRQATVSASTKRSPSISGGKRGVPTTNLTGLSCTPLDPVNPEVSQRLGLDTPHELLQTFLADASGFIELVVEELKR